ncbi:UNVERIFIED_CONTAM: hypothetical protein FKN15_021599 [Acipenser sinensis]
MRATAVAVLLASWWLPWLPALPSSLPATSSFQSKSALNHLLLDPTTGHLYVGAVDRLFHLSGDLELLSRGETGPRMDMLLWLPALPSSLPATSSFQSESALNHLLLDPTTGHLYVGAVDRLFHLSGDLELLSRGETGPRMDSPDCLPPINQECQQATDTNNHNKLLLLGAPREEGSLIVCGTVFQGICEKRSLGNVSVVLYRTENPVDTQYVAANDPRVTTVGVVVELEEPLLFVGRGYTSKGPGGVPPITTRHLRGHNAFTHEELGKLVVGSYSEYNNNFVAALRAGGHVYFVFFRRDRRAKREYRTYVSRLCVGDRSFYSYVEVPLRCAAGEKVYNLAQATFLSTAEDGEATLYVVMAAGTASTPAPSRDTALCAFPLAELDGAIVRAQELCYVWGETGPRMDSPDCLPPINQECQQATDTNNHNKLLLLGAPREEGSLIVCGTVFQGICEKRSLGNVSVVSLSVDRLPSLGEGESFSCMFGTLPGQPAVVTGTEVTCQSPPPEQVPPSDPGKDHVVVSLSLKFNGVAVAATEFIFYDCSAVSGLSVRAPCVGSDWECNWCLLEHSCTHEESCPAHQIIYNHKLAVNWTSPSPGPPAPSHTLSNQITSSPPEPSQPPIRSQLPGSAAPPTTGSPSSVPWWATPPVGFGFSGWIDWEEVSNGPSFSLAEEASLISDPWEPVALKSEKQIEPVAGPLEGNIALTITGSNLGQRFEEIELTVSAAGLSCTPDRNRYQISIRIVCAVSPSVGDTSGPVRVIVGDREPAVSTQVFTYQNPELTSVFPEKGPVAGGTSLTINGIKLKTGQPSDVTAFVGHVPCEIVEVEDTFLVCRTDPANQTEALPVRVLFGQAERTLGNVVFHFRENPVIAKTNASKSFYSGGRVIQVSGRNLDVVQNPLLQVWAEPSEGGWRRRRGLGQSQGRHQRSTENSTLKEFSEVCAVQSSEVMECPSPRVPAGWGVSGVLFVLDNLRVPFSSVGTGEEFLYHPDPVFKPLTEDTEQPYHFKPGSVIMVEVHIGP